MGAEISMGRLVLRGARWPGDVAVRGGLIEAVGSIEAEPGDEVLWVDGDIITAGLINTHHHLYQWATRAGVRHLLVQGEAVVKDGELTGLDLRAARGELARRSARLWN